MMGDSLYDSGDIGIDVYVLVAGNVVEVEELWECDPPEDEHRLREPVDYTPVDLLGIEAQHEAVKLLQDALAAASSAPAAAGGAPPLLLVCTSSEPSPVLLSLGYLRRWRRLQQLSVSRHQRQRRSLRPCA